MANLNFNQDITNQLWSSYRELRLKMELHKLDLYYIEIALYCSPKIYYYIRRESYEYKPEIFGRKIYVCPDLAENEYNFNISLK